MQKLVYECPENPWDGSGFENSGTRTKALDYSRMLKFCAVLSTAIILLLLTLSAVVNADQSAKAKKDPIANKTKVKVELKGDMKEAAEEYAYLLEQLLYLSSDYCRYFEKLDDKSAGESYKALANMCARISEEERYENVNKIIVEINSLKKELADRERELARLQRELESEDSELKDVHANLKALKLTASLREELESLDEQMQEEVVWRMADRKEYQEAINQYVKALINDSIISVIQTLGRSHAPNVQFFKRDGDEEIVVVEVPDAPDNQYVYGTPVPQPSNPAPPIAEIPGHFEGAAFYRELKDSLAVPSADIGIYVTNAFGDLEVVGWAQKQVVGVYTVAISSDKLKSSEQFDENVHLRLYPKLNKIYIESIVPHLADPKMKVIKSQLHLKVPSGNDLFLSNSSGHILVGDIKSNVTVKSTGCSVELRDVDGNTEIINSAGAITLANVSGKSIVQNRMGPVTLTACNGSIEVGNSFGPVSISNSDGDAVVRNTGPVAIAGHVGNLEITNRSGPIDIKNLEGNVAAFNSFDLLRAQDIRGTAKFVNANAPVEVVAIKGNLSVTNRFAPITVSSSSGPLYIENKSGDINLQLSTAMHGSSNVISSGGQIFLAIAPRSNLMVTMESTGGQIDMSGFDATVEDLPGGVQLAKLKVGNGSNTLDVKAGNSKLVVKPFQKLALTTEF
jgi:hypothetical protein